MARDQADPNADRLLGVMEDRHAGTELRSVMVQRRDAMVQRHVVMEQHRVVMTGLPQDVTERRSATGGRRVPREPERGRPGATEPQHATGFPRGMVLRVEALPPRVVRLVVMGVLRVGTVPQSVVGPRLAAEVLSGPGVPRPVTIDARPGTRTRGLAMTIRSFPKRSKRNNSTRSRVVNSVP
jgi:hypothetical protein